MKNELVEIVFIIDKSGSMSGFRNETIEGYNKFLSKQKELEGDAIISTLLFNNKLTPIHERVDISKVKNITVEEYITKGSTALYDTIGKSIDNLSYVHRLSQNNLKPSKVIYVIITDGLENSSEHYTKKHIKEMISNKKELENWEFIFMGTNFDVEEFAESINIEKSNAFKYENNSEGVIANYRLMDDLIKRVRNDDEFDINWKEKIMEEDKK